MGSTKLGLLATSTFILFLGTMKICCAMEGNERNEPEIDTSFYKAFKPLTNPTKDTIQSFVTYPEEEPKWDEVTGRYYYGKKLSEMVHPQASPVPLLAEWEMAIFTLIHSNDKVDRISYSHPLPCMPNKDPNIIKKPGEYPWCAIGLLQMDYGAEETRYVGSGVLIGNNLVLTAAHNFLSCELKKSRIPKRITFYPGLSQNKILWKSVVEQVAVHPMWYERRADEDSVPTKSDIAILKLRDNLGKKLGYFGIKPIDGPSLSDIQQRKDTQEINVTGYPGSGHNEMYNIKSKILNITTDQLYYGQNTYDGQSGSPVWINHQGMPLCIGIHGYHDGEKRASSGVLINEEKFLKIKKWMSFFAGQYPPCELGVESEKSYGFVSRPDFNDKMLIPSTIRIKDEETLIISLPVEENKPSDNKEMKETSVYISLPNQDEYIMQSRWKHAGSLSDSCWTSSPWKTFGHLTIVYATDSGKGIYHASGVLIEKNIVLTTAIAMYYRGAEVNRWSNVRSEFLPERLEMNFVPRFYPSYVSFSTGSHLINIDRIIFDPVHTKGTASNNEAKIPFAILRLTEPLEETISFMLKSPEEKDLSQQINVTGYSAQNILNTAKGKLHSWTTENLYYNVDTQLGESGGGIWIEEKNEKNEEKPYLIGIHTHNYHSAGTLKSGVRFTENTIELIKKWIKYLNED